MMSDCIEEAACRAPFFCGVNLDRLAGERDDEAKMDALTHDPDALCLVYSGPSAEKVCMKSNLLVRVPLSEAVTKGDEATMTFLGMEESSEASHEGGRVPLFAIVSDEVVGEGSEFVDVLRGCGEGVLNRETGALAAYGKLMLRQHTKNGVLFCPCCGSATESRAAGTKRHCVPCKRDLFTRTDPVAIVLVVHPDDPTRTLLVRKPQYKPRTRHTCVAGFIEPGESAEEGARREVKEETNIDIDPATVRFIASQPWPSNIGSQLMIAFMCRAKKDTAPLHVDTEELDDAQWYTVDQVREALRLKEATPETELTLPQSHALAFTMLSRWVQQMDSGTLHW